MWNNYREHWNLNHENTKKNNNGTTTEEHNELEQPKELKIPSKCAKIHQIYTKTKTCPI